MNESPDVDLDRLVQQGAWLRHFVGTLVRAQDADDVVQTAWLAAVEHRERARGNVAGWLAGVARNVARMLHRSRRRGEHAVQGLPPRGDEASAADVLAGLEVQRAVSEALLALPEPTRTVVVLRYHEGLAPDEIAARVGLRVDAVRQRLHRGRDAVRERLQQRFGADWRGSPAVLAFAGDAQRVLPFGVVPAAMITVLASAVIATAVLIAQSHGGRLAEELTPRRVEHASAAPIGNERLVADSQVTERVLVATQPQEPTPEPSPPAGPTQIEVRGRLLTAEDGSPIAGATIARDREEGILSGADGRFVFVYGPASNGEIVWVRAAGRCDRWWLQQTRSVDLGDITMACGHTVTGRVLDTTGAAIPDARVEVRLDGEVPDGSISFPTKTDAGGMFAFTQLAPSGPLALDLESPRGFVLENEEPVVVASSPNHFVLRARLLRSVSGIVVDEGGRPCADVDLSTNPTQERHVTFTGVATRSMADGTFEVFDHRPADGGVTFLDTGDHAAHEMIGPRIRCDWGARDVRLVVKPLAPVRLLVVDAESGHPITAFNALSRVLRGTNIMQTGSGNLTTERSDGRYTFAGLPADAFVVVFATDPERAPVVLAAYEAMRGQADVRVALPKLEPFVLELVDARGDPIVAEFDVIDRRGIEAPVGWSDFLAGKHHVEPCMPVSAFRVSSGKTDAKGNGTLRAPTDARDLALRFTREGRNVWVPIQLPANGAPLRLVAPD